MAPLFCKMRLSTSGERPQVVGHEQRRRQHRVQRHLSARLATAQREVTDDQLSMEKVANIDLMSCPLLHLPGPDRSSIRVQRTWQIRPGDRRCSRSCPGDSPSCPVGDKFPSSSQFKLLALKKYTNLLYFFSNSVKYFNYSLRLFNFSTVLTYNPLLLNGTSWL